MDPADAYAANNPDGGGAETVRLTADVAPWEAAQDAGRGTTADPALRKQDEQIGAVKGVRDAVDRVNRTLERSPVLKAA
jgi:hypothetical protein